MEVSFREYFLKFIVSKYDRNTISNCYVVSVFSLSGRYFGNGRIYRAVSRPVCFMFIYTPALTKLGSRSTGSLPGSFTQAA